MTGLGTPKAVVERKTRLGESGKTILSSERVINLQVDFQPDKHRHIQ
jgi:hypothetical protein